MKGIFFIFFLFFFISSISASDFNLSAGESITFDLEEEFDNYAIVGNSTLADNLEITSNGTNVTLDIGLLANPDTFTIVFYNDKEVVKEVQVGGGSGSTRTIYKDKNVTQYVDREVEVEVEKDNDEEIQGYINVANESLKREFWWKLGFAISFSILLIEIFKIIKDKKMIKSSNNNKK